MKWSQQEKQEIENVAKYLTELWREMIREEKLKAYCRVDSGRLIIRDNEIMDAINLLETITKMEEIR